MAKSDKRKLIEKMDKVCRDIVLIRDKNTCQMCGKYAERHNAHASHVVPKSVSGYLRHNLNNLKLLCYRCHFYVWHIDPIKSEQWFKKKFPYRYRYVQKNRRHLDDIDLEKHHEKLKRKLTKLLREQKGGCLLSE